MSISQTVVNISIAQIQCLTCTLKTNKPPAVWSSVNFNCIIMYCKISANRIKIKIKKRCRVGVMDICVEGTHGEV